MPESETQKLYPQATIRDFYYVLFRQKRKIILFFCTVMVVVILGTFLLPKTYQSEAKLLVRLGRENVSLPPTAATGQMLNISQTRENEIKTEMEILTSRGLAEKVVDAIGYKSFLSWDPDPALKTVSAQRADLSLPLVASSSPDILAEKFNPSLDVKDRDKIGRAHV